MKTLANFPVSNKLFHNMGKIRKYYLVILLCRVKSSVTLFLSNYDFAKVDYNHVIQIPIFSYKYRSTGLEILSLCQEHTSKPPMTKINGTDTGFS